jgi:hypothetical protein
LDLLEKNRLNGRHMKRTPITWEFKEQVLKCMTCPNEASEQVKISIRGVIINLVCCPVCADLPELTLIDD